MNQVTPNHQIRTSVITNCAWVQFDKERTLHQQDLLPHNWFKAEGLEENIEDIRDQSALYHETLKPLRKIKTDHIDLAVRDRKDAEGHKPCPNCGSLVKKGNQYCDNPNCNVHVKSARKEAANQDDNATVKPPNPKLRK